MWWYFGQAVLVRSKWGGVALILLVASFFASSVAAQGAIQVFGQYSSGSYIGIQAYVSMTTGTNTAGHWTAGPTGFRRVSQNVYIESGPSRYLSSDSNIHPYGSGKDKNGAIHFNVNTSVNLSSGGQYQYYSNRYSGNNFQSVYCSGGGCQQMVTIDAGVSAMEVLVSGGEGLDASSHWGTVTTKYNSYIPSTGGSYKPWCYNQTISAGTTNKPSACFNSGDGNINVWTAKY